MTAVTRKIDNPQRWHVFVTEYLKDFSPGGAYLRAFGALTAQGNKVECEKRGKRLIQTNEWIRNKILEKSQGRITLADVTPERITLELARIAFADIRKVSTVRVTSEGVIETPVPAPMFDDDTASAVRSIKYDVRGNRVVEFADKAGALRTLAQLATMNMRPRTAAAQADNLSRDHDAIAEDEILAMFNDESARIEDDVYSDAENELEEIADDE